MLVSKQRMERGNPGQSWLAVAFLACTGRSSRRKPGKLQNDPFPSLNISFSTLYPSNKCGNPRKWVRSSLTFPPAFGSSRPACWAYCGLHEAYAKRRQSNFLISSLLLQKASSSSLLCDGSVALFVFPLGVLIVHLIRRSDDETTLRKLRETSSLLPSKGFSL